jgi:hypothetical protein
VGARAVLERVLTLALVAGAAACDILPRAGDTRGEQLAGRWDWHGRLSVETDDRYTLVRLKVDTTGVTERHDILTARFEFDPGEGSGGGDEYALSVALEIGDARRLAANHPYRLGTDIPAYATVTCFCRPLHPDSVRGTYTMSTRGIRQLAGRIDATLYFTAWDDPGVHATYRLRQRIHGVRP